VKDLAKPLTGKKIAENSPTHYAHEPKWEIPDNMDVSTGKGLRAVEREENSTKSVTCS